MYRTAQAPDLRPALATNARLLRQLRLAHTISTVAMVVAAAALFAVHQSSVLGVLLVLGLMVIASARVMLPSRRVEITEDGIVLGDDGEMILWSEIEEARLVRGPRMLVRTAARTELLWIGRRDAAPFQRRLPEAPREALDRESPPSRRPQVGPWTSTKRIFTFETVRTVLLAVMVLSIALFVALTAPRQ